MRNWLRRLVRVFSGRSCNRSRPAYQPSLEAFEGRCLMAGYVQTNLVSDVPGLAHTTDPNLINPWGVAFVPGGPFWVANNNSGFATVYDAAGNPFPSGSPIIVKIPPP